MGGRVQVVFQGVEPVFSAPDRGEGIYLLSHDRYFKPPVLAGLRRFRINDRAMLYLIPSGVEMELPRLKFHGLFHGVPRVALPPRCRDSPGLYLRVLPVSGQPTHVDSRGRRRQSASG